MKKWIPSALSAILLLGVMACAPGSEEKNDHKVLRLGLVPFETGEELLKDIQPLLNVIEKGMDMEVQPSVAADYTGVVESLKNKQLDAAFLSPASYVLAKQEANVRIIVKSQRNGSASYYGAIIVRADSPIHKLTDLKGKKFSFGDPISTSGHIFARKIMKEAGVNPDTDLDKVIYSGSHDATILAVLNDKVDAGATYADDNQGKSSAWSRFLKPEDLKKIRVLTYTEPIPSDTICVSEDFPEALTQRLQKTILDYSQSPEGKALIKKLYHFDGYVEANDADYKSVREGFAAAGIDLKAKLKKSP
ncbi:phosphate/phosphite/phosphonate ABC transporter substrate-binding protein [bacterium (Candidatus Blackallbacteria) CG17_big_fil_post_rev_8_21_14_2_50_48_46]|uniref:Phosphate/phosphite/phosphonate ABC transporter substrate-binding protein n=1 Tax=bacterium (Candidatus Blackallbacteria) CG17_big_fil_post_rev_8_21_14_2_50_48_46 TaxID=2014261 RepID=A0A2M7G3Y2_9BACT|nr:MAG: phosphonate ABC transporter substrate-binding protein [bacterium (Candidatus Blackallbacteria) CG18_big_fil_WC_8_21_14_2_50_49_26]PIW16563.1 MAG: phosphate/phosphite/phosphonate ABC transporter substrate-binding protein [bacterium (Candidatus Blackallbacteria) CG17_big_fil_post_rev_8_21_14_2_50_48_46]PIW46071.1 MAG: phosphate/phosphite/phosphonate ABC transporter substrate-binding protein [bacterium (Candidatus Blackallbacteria) CG13_big_fil_rev_8_21_14_2_50_49_14]